MLPMQRSFSSPSPVQLRAAADATPLTSMRPSTPPSSKSHADSEQPRRASSPEPALPNPPTSVPSPDTMPQTLLVRRVESVQQAPTLHQTTGSNSRKAIVAQPRPPSASVVVQEAVAGPTIRPVSEDQPSPAAKPTTKMLQPLITDAALYTNAYLTPGDEAEGTSLDELAHLVRLSKYQERKRANTRVRLQRTLVSTALSARLTRCGEIAQRNLAECFRSDDKKTFSSLYGAIQDVRKSCDEVRRYALLEPEMEAMHSSAMVSSESLETPTGSVVGTGPMAGSTIPFLHEISADARETFLSFLSKIRNDPDYLATRLCALTNAERGAITNFHSSLEPVESVLPLFNKPHGRGPGSVSGRHSSSNPNPVERLLSFQRHDALSALIHTCFANSAGPDSAEDKRRTDIWATACARLISKSATESKAGNENVPIEPVLIHVLNVWSVMREWSGRSNMEWYLMKILEDGAFLLSRAEDQHGTRFNISDWTSKDQIAAEEFYDRATDELFEILDDEDATGLPEGLIELGNQILRRLDHKYVESTRKWLVYKWLFSVWLLGVVVHPESHGMMTDYHITEYGRQKILKQVAMKASSIVVDMLWKAGPVSTSPKIKAHIDNLLGRFKNSRSKPRPRLLKARSLTSLRETAEVHPYLVVSPADLVTLVNALFPERRPMSSHSMRSGAPSISGMSVLSQPMSIRTTMSNPNFETASIISTSVSSVLSDTTTAADALDHQATGTSARSSPPLGPRPSHERLGHFEEDGCRLRLALQELMESLGPDALQGSCHPCAERWAVLFISADGRSLSTHMTYDPDDEPEEENSSSLSDTDEDDMDDDRPALDKDYHQLRDSIFKLVEDFEIPQSSEQDTSKFSNRTSTLKKYRSRTKIITTERIREVREPRDSRQSRQAREPSRNPYRQRLLGQDGPSRDDLSESPTEKGKEIAGKAHDQAEPTPTLIAMLEAAVSQTRAQSDYSASYSYYNALLQLSALASSSLRANGFATLLNIFSRGPRDSIRRSASAIEDYDAWLVWLKQSQERAEGFLDSMVKRLRALRDKMWYVTDVRNSAPYEHSRSIAVALKNMGMRRKVSTHQRSRNLPRGAPSTYIYRTESQIIELLAASEEQGGPNKLSDDQAEKTSLFLKEYNIENFCRGEERIHRFCCEVEACIGKLIGHDIMDGPVLWSSELFARDKRQLEAPPVRREIPASTFSNDDTSSIASDSERRFAPISGRTGSLAARDLRGITALNASALSLESNRYGFSTRSTLMSDPLDSGDYFGHASPVHTIDSASTYWSPFQSGASVASTNTSRAHSPTTSITNFSGAMPFHHGHGHAAGRPGTGISVNDAAHQHHQQQQRLSDEKARFLQDLRQTLTSLLLSDLGNLVFSRGSETDGWFEDLGQDCIDRRNAAERKAKNKRTKPRVIEKKKSFGNLRDANMAADVAKGPTGDRSASELHNQLANSLGRDNDSSATSDTMSSMKSSKSRKDAMPEFPFTSAYQRLLRMFCVHPNPYAKLNALYELEHLIVASLSSGNSRRRLAWLAKTAEMEAENQGSANRLRPFDEAIDTLRERRSHTMQFPGLGRMPSGNLNPETRSVINTATAATNSDAIATVLQSLFRNADIRPKTLFRDLQFIATFVPTSILDKTDRGKAFWDCAIAAMGLKQEVCRTMVEMADEIVGVHTTKSRKSRPPAPSSTASDSINGEESQRPSPNAEEQATRVASVSPPTPPPPSTSYQLEDAARMLVITAKEGDPTSQRELALFYLSNPELVERTTLPLSKPREVFKQAVMEKFRGANSGSSSNSRYGQYHERIGAGQLHRPGSSGSAAGMGNGGVDKSDVRSDPAIMCVAIHWMEAAEQGNDEVARTFLGQNDELGGF
ncbi:hypothetical protein BD289DRAFT_484257 [Coniella lustricola]|uniref:Uncharacterized protein n=1 Tax=Coniella lustricola TaxID=2025994 RepID=A0A2T3A2L6_9PEZI|nr:hypothetical protein BD289DRAFT_484257 [Coniella lustricola]